MIMLLTEGERERFNSLEEGSYYGQIGITIRFGNHFWHEHSGSLLAGACGGDNLPTLIEVKKHKKVPHGTIRDKGEVVCLDSKVGMATSTEVSCTLLATTFKEPPAIIRSKIK